MGSQHVDEDYEEVTEEVFARRAQARQRQITIGKSRPEYKLYSTSVQYHRRIEQMPHTPDPHARISKRAFDRELACWRRGLHVWSAQLDGASDPAARKAESYEERSLPVVELGQKWADFSPCGKDWSPAGTESTRADLDSEGSSPTRSHCQTPGAAPAAGNAKSMWNAASNVKLNLFEHLSPPVPVPLPPQQPILPSPAGSSPAMQQMMPALPATQGWEMYPGSMCQGMVPGGGSAPAAQMIQFPSVDQQQFNGNYAMPYWGEPMPAWGSTQQCPSLPPQSQPMPLVAPQALPTDPCIGIAGAADVNTLQQPMMWQAPMPQQRLPGTPRGSNRPAEDTPSTPLNRVVRSILSPAAASPSWMRTPSPDQHHYPMSQFRTAEQRQEPAPVVAQLQLPVAQLQEAADPWVNTTLMVATRSYFAESEGYMSVAVGSQVRAMIDNPHCGDSKCAFPTYVYCCQGNGAGWAPQQLLWRCYVDESGRRWACDDATGAWCWVDEMEKNAIA